MVETSKVPAMDPGAERVEAVLGGHHDVEQLTPEKAMAVFTVLRQLADSDLLFVLRLAAAKWMGEPGVQLVESAIGWFRQECTLCDPDTSLEELYGSIDDPVTDEDSTAVMAELNAIVAQASHRLAFLATLAEQAALITRSRREAIEAIAEDVGVTAEAALNKELDWLFPVRKATE